MVAGVETRLMYIDENESGLQLVVKGIDGVNEMLAWFFS